jgi:acetyl-CoA synthetase
MKDVTADELTANGLGKPTAAEMAKQVNGLAASYPATECWRRISKEILTPDHPFELHRFLYRSVYADWDAAQGPPPAWLPPEGSPEATNIGRLMAQRRLDSYEALHAWSVANRDEFWDCMIRTLGIRLNRPYDTVMDVSQGMESPQWLAGAVLNMADSCFNTRGESPAIVCQVEGGALASMSYDELNAMTNRVANGLKGRRYGAGDAVACYMPMTAESVAVYLGIVKAGCVAVSIADSFAPDEVNKRLAIANAKGIVTQDVMVRAGKRLPLYEKAVAADGPAAIVLPGEDGPVQADLRDGDTTWEDFLADDDRFDAMPRAPHDWTNILFSSGTTGDPKAIPWTQTTPIKCAVDGYLHHDIRAGDVVAWPTNLGWMMGPWLIYASLVNHATIALYYGAPTGREFVEFVEKAGVTMLGVVPSLVKAWRNGDGTAGADWSAIRAFSSTGECSNVDDMLFLMSRAGYKPVIEYCGGTEIGGGYITGTVVQPAAPATFSTPALGIDLVLLDEDGGETDNGEVFLVPPSIGLSTELMNRDHHDEYFDGTPPGPHGELLRRHGDQIERLGGGYYRAHGRTDDTMNLGGIKVSSAEIERTLNRVEGIHETAAIGVADKAGGPARLVVYAVLMPEADRDEDALKDALQREIKGHLNPLFRLHDLVIVDALPRTASNKIMHRKLRTDYADRQ